MVIVKGPVEHAELRHDLLEELEPDVGASSAVLAARIYRRQRRALGRFAPEWRRVEVFLMLDAMRLEGLVVRRPDGWCRLERPSPGRSRRCL